MDSSCRALVAAGPSLLTVCRGPQLHSTTPRAAAGQQAMGEHHEDVVRGVAGRLPRFVRDPGERVRWPASQPGRGRGG